MKRTVAFSARELRNSSGALLREAEAGRLSIITKHGRPAAVAVPFEGALLEVGVHIHLAVRLFEQRLITLAQAAKLAGKSIEEFLDVLKACDVDVVDYPAAELAEELKALP
jgi:prevent-host-death family protein